VKKLRITVNGVSYDVDVEVLEDDEDGASYGYHSTSIQVPRPSVSQPVAEPKRASTPTPSAPPSTSSGSNELVSPIAGIVNEIKVNVGSQVKENDILVVIEAMKMNTNINSPVSGKVKEIKVSTGDAVQQGQVLMTFE